MMSVLRDMEWWYNKALRWLDLLYLQSLRVELDIWITNVERILMSSQEACVWFVDMMGSAKGSGYLKYVIISAYCALWYQCLA